MKKLSLYVFLVLMFCNVGFAKCIKGDCINGQGTYDYLHGEKYVGEHKDGREHGQGTFTRMGEKYVGGWKDGKQHGQGTYTTRREKYVGEYKDGKRHGQGTYTWDSGGKYVGEFVGVKSPGRETYTYTWDSGGKYVGEFIDGKLHGQGTLIWADGTVEKGIWENGKLVEPN